MGDQELASTHFPILTRQFDFEVALSSAEANDHTLVRGLFKHSRLNMLEYTWDQEALFFNPEYLRNYLLYPLNTNTSI